MVTIDEKCVSKWKKNNLKVIVPWLVPILTRWYCLGIEPEFDFNFDGVSFCRRQYWSTRTTWWTFVSSTAALTRTGCPTSWTSSPGVYPLSAKRVSQNHFKSKSKIFTQIPKTSLLKLVCGLLGKNLSWSVITNQLSKVFVNCFYRKLIMSLLLWRFWNVYLFYDVKP